MSQPFMDVGQKYNYADYCTWSDDERWELIEGVPYNMSPAPSRGHQEVTGELFVQIKNFLRDRPCRVYIAPFDVRLSDETVVQPDLSIICDPAKLDEKGCRGAPDWIIEVLSPRTASRDHVLKRDLYQRHGVTEYWLVHPTERVVTLYRFAENQPVEIIEARGETPCAVFPGFNIDWDGVFEENRHVASG